MTEAEDKVRRHMKMHYRVDLDDLEISDVPGYWQDKEPKEHRGHPLRATYVFYDSRRDITTGKYVSPYRTWRILHEKKRGVE